MRDFNTKINTALLNERPSQTQKEQYSDEEMNHAVRLCDSIMEVFKKDNTDMLTAYMVLSSLADSIYVSAVFGDVDDLK